MKYARYAIGILMLFVVVICGFNLCKLSAYAGTYDNAYTFYNYYGNDVHFSFLEKSIDILYIK